MMLPTARFVALGIKGRPPGVKDTPFFMHCARARLLAEGLSLKEIGDHLGHRSTSATSIYAKVNMDELRKVAAFGDLEISHEHGRARRELLFGPQTQEIAYVAGSD